MVISEGLAVMDFNLSYHLIYAGEHYKNSSILLYNIYVLPIRLFKNNKYIILHFYLKVTWINSFKCPFQGLLMLLLLKQNRVCTLAEYFVQSFLAEIGRRNFRLHLDSVVCLTLII